MGSVFLQNYYSIYDSENSKIGLALDIVSLGYISDTTSFSSKIFLMALGIFFGVVLLILLVFVVIVKLRKRRTTLEDEKLDNSAKKEGYKEKSRRSLSIRE